MAITAFSQWSTTAASNTDLNSIPLDGASMLANQVDDAIRELMAQLANAGFITLTGGVTSTLSPATSDGAALGSTTKMWSDLFLASGGVINWNNGDVTVTHSANALAFAGASSGYSVDAKLFPATNDGAALGDTTHNFSDLFLATGAVINVNNSNWVATHSSGVLTVGTGDLRVTTAGTNGASVVTVDGTQTLANKTLTAPSASSLTITAGSGITWTGAGANITESGSVLSTNAIFSLGAGQLVFPATQNPSANANTLDDYEEGTWSPTVGFGSGTTTVTTAYARYTKIGNRVFFGANFTWSSPGTATGLFTFTLPFTASQSSNVFYGTEGLNSWVLCVASGTTTVNVSQAGGSSVFTVGSKSVVISGHFDV